MRFNGPVELVVIEASRGLFVAVGMVDQGSNEKAEGVSQSAVPVLEEPVGTALAVDYLYFAGVGRGVDEGWEGEEGNSESTAECYRVGEWELGTSDLYTWPLQFLL